MLAHGFPPQQPLYHMWRLLEDRIDRLPDAIITSTANSADLLMKRFNCPSNRVFTVADCVNTDTFACWAINNSNGYSDRLEQLRVSLGVPPGYKLVVYVGLLQNTKE